MSDVNHLIVRVAAGQNPFVVLEDGEVARREGGLSRRGMFQQLAQKAVTAPVLQHAAVTAITQATQSALAKPVAPWHDLPQQLRALPHVAMSYGFKHAGTETKVLTPHFGSQTPTKVHTFKHENGSELIIHEPKHGESKRFGGHTGAWRLKTPDGDHVVYHPEHGTALSALDNELEAQHNPKPEWFSNKHLTPATPENTDFETQIPADHPHRTGKWHVMQELPYDHPDRNATITHGYQKYKPTAADQKAQHFMVHIDRESHAPGSKYETGAGSHPQFRSLMRRAGLAHMLPHSGSGVGYDDIAIPFKSREHAVAAARELRGAAGNYDYSSGPRYDSEDDVQEYYGSDPVL